ncbi:uncharacterized protein BcabD6B2_09480 [Babesia caballi]|uniref:Uncharacterized protein n=1 Tax=Babesia caballi TaxID=5871 RepID=A0AAV4LMX4_BABCB|nr:hypothetical protein BcabD6B2_09480 [Babesia caballi]
MHVTQTDVAHRGHDALLARALVQLRHRLLSVRVVLHELRQLVHGKAVALRGLGLPVPDCVLRLPFFRAEVALDCVPEGLRILLREAQLLRGGEIAQQLGPLLPEPKGPFVERQRAIHVDRASDAVELLIAKRE